MTAAFRVWGLLLYPDAVVHAKGNLTFFPALTQITSVFCLMALRSAALSLATLAPMPFFAFFMLADGARMVPEALRLAPAAAGMISILYRHNRTFPKLIRSKRILLQRQEGTRKLSDFTLDDFGAVSTSLTYLQSCGFSCVKTDRILIKRLETAPKAHGPVSVGVQMAKGLDVRVVAEGVETEQTAQVLKAAGCNELQGCYFGRPESLSNARLGAAAAETATVAA